MSSKFSSSVCHQMSWNVFQFNMVTHWWKMETFDDILRHFMPFDDIWAKNHVVYHDMSWHFMTCHDMTPSDSERHYVNRRNVKYKNSIVTRQENLFLKMKGKHFRWVCHLNNNVPCISHLSKTLGDLNHEHWYLLLLYCSKGVKYGDNGQLLSYHLSHQNSVVSEYLDMNHHDLS